MSELHFPSPEELHQLHVRREYSLSVAGSELEVVEDELAEEYVAMFEDVEEE